MIEDKEGGLAAVEKNVLVKKTPANIDFTSIQKLSRWEG